MIDKKSGLKELVKIAGSSAMGGIEAGRFRGSLDTEIQFAQSDIGRAAVAQFLANARRLLDEFVRQNPGHVVSADTIALVDELSMITDEGQGKVTLGRFKTALSGEAEQSRIAAERAEKQALALDRARTRLAVGALVAQELEAMDYTVSGIDETCFAKDGHLYMQDREAPGHAVRITVAPDGKGLVSTPIRLETDEAMAADTSVGGASREDKQFDSDWCSSKGLKRLERRLEVKGLKTGFGIIDRNASPVVRMARSEMPKMPEIAEVAVPAVDAKGKSKGKRKMPMLADDDVDMLSADDKLMAKLRAG
jgi:hypothetical protein